MEPIIIHLRDDPYGIPEGSEIAVTNYESGSYEGSGYAYCLDGAKVHEHNLGHCSCNGPFDGGPDNSWDKDEFLRLVEDENVTVGTISDLEAAKRLAFEMRSRSEPDFVLKRVDECIATLKKCGPEFEPVVGTIGSCIAAYKSRLENDLVEREKKVKELADRLGVPVTFASKRKSKK